MSKGYHYLKENGFTLIELLIAIFLASLLGMAGVAIFSSSNRAYKMNEDVAEAQQNSRVAMERFSQDIRTAGFGLPDPPFDLNIGSNWTAPITVTTSGGSGNPDSITILGIGYEVGKLEGSSTNCAGSGKVPNSESAECIHLSDASKFFPGGSFDASRMYINIGGAKFIQLAPGGHDSTNRILALGNPPTLDREYKVGTPVFIIQAVTYSIENDCTVSNPCWNLKSNDLTGLRGSGNQVLAENIEDIQFAYGVDVNVDGKLDSSTLSNDPTDDASILAVRATVVARTRNKDMKGALFTRPVVEDHSAGPSDNYRRRVLTKVLKLRNPRTGGL